MPYLAMYADFLREAKMARLAETFKVQAVVLWRSWITSFDTFWTYRGAIPVCSALLLLAAAGLVQRLRRRRLDAFYVIFYLLIVLFWPFPAHVPRFIYVVLPILLLYAVLASQTLVERSRHTALRLMPHACCVAALLVSSPTDALLARRFFSPSMQTLHPTGGPRSGSAWYRTD